MTFLFIHKNSKNNPWYNPTNVVSKYSKFYWSISGKIQIIATIKRKTFVFRENNVQLKMSFNSEIISVDGIVSCIWPNLVVNICDLCNIIYNHNNHLLYLFKVLFLEIKGVEDVSSNNQTVSNTLLTG